MSNASFTPSTVVDPVPPFPTGIGKAAATCTHGVYVHTSSSKVPNLFHSFPVPHSCICCIIYDEERTDITTILNPCSKPEGVFTRLDAIVEVEARYIPKFVNVSRSVFEVIVVPLCRL